MGKGPEQFFYFAIPKPFKKFLEGLWMDGDLTLGLAR